MIDDQVGERTPGLSGRRRYLVSGRVFGRSQTDEDEFRSDARDRPGLIRPGHERFSHPSSGAYSRADAGSAT